MVLGVYIPHGLILPPPSVPKATVKLCKEKSRQALDGPARGVGSSYSLEAPSHPLWTMETGRVGLGPLKWLHLNMGTTGSDQRRSWIGDS